MIPDKLDQSATADKAPCSRARASSEGRSRRRHHKSRAGCRSCKSRRVKCDEVRPACTNCTKRDVACEYFDTRRYLINRPDESPKILPRLGQTSDGSTVSPASSTQTDCSSIPSGLTPSQNLFPEGVGTPDDRLLDLRLFCHYLEMTTRSTDIQMSWAFWIVQEASQSPSVMDALLGFSAFHLRRHHKHDEALRDASHRFMARAIKRHREQLRAGFNDTNAASIVATCALVTFHSSVNHAFLDSEEAGQRQPVRWFRSFQMTMHIIRMARFFSPGTDLCRRLAGIDKMQHDVMEGKADGEFGFLLEYLDPLGPSDEESLLAYSQAVALLSSLYCNLEDATPLLFFITVSPRYVDLLAAKDPRALAILGYFFMLVKKSRHFWWIDGAPECEFDAVMSLLPHRWRPVMDWATLEFAQQECSPQGLGFNLSET
ncbi:hypothetical protein CEP51_016138 [Fusarium floridanum]|uniref:Zn(2)-C6 fungal-type domain-containing protein n=1 Tax=Fusarium floridanum TaxID=1325733 RepID=A0A428NWG7_9HYPO|nr:hypothetical protein CEP51_016138 [Fusarium floridanum]